jgi:hypothetical protein
MDPDKKKIFTIISVATVIIIILAFAVFYFVRKAKMKEAEVAEIVEQMNFEKEQVQKEYSGLNQEFGGYTSNIKNDSIVKLLQNQKIKVDQLLNELRITKSTNARRISQLKHELATVRQVMILYVNQIDSLNAANRTLKTENVEVHRKYRAANDSVVKLSKDKESLNQVVTRASILEVYNFSMTPLNSKGKKTGWYSQTTNLQFKYTIGKNITAQPGEKTIYLRITRPDDEVLTKSPNNVFPYENKNIAYSASKSLEYTGETKSDVIYWKVGEILPKGKYRAEFFADGYRIGSFSFTFEK